MKKSRELMKNYKYCPICGSNLLTKKVNGQMRAQCPECRWVDYANPVPSVTAFVYDKGRILLVKRGVAPGKNKWALPSGFIEQHEHPEHAVMRELREETNLRGTVERLIGVYTEPTRIYGNVLLIAYLLRNINGQLKSGSDTTDVQYFPHNKLPSIAFASHRAIIRDAMRDSEESVFVDVLKSKITEATITHTQLFYKGSMGIDGAIMEEAGLVPGEKVHVLNYDNGERLVTYTIREKPRSGKFVLYGPAAHKGAVGDRLCILAYARVNLRIARSMTPHVIILDGRNKIKRKHA
jgi:8-oxo-dGTP diphosphatase